MATERLDLGRVRGADGANGKPATVEVLEDTATSYVLGITYYDMEGVEHLIQTPNLLGAEGSATFTIRSDEDLQKWMDAEEGNDYTHVVVKPGNYTLTGVVKLLDAGTEMISGFGAELNGIEIRGSGTEVSAGLTAQKFVDMLAVVSDGKILLENLSTAITAVSNADNLTTAATQENYDKIRYGNAGSGTELTGLNPAKVATGVRAEENPEETLPSIVYVQGDNDDYILKGDEKVVSATGFNIPTAIKRVLAHSDGTYLHLHVLTTDGNLYYVEEQADGLHYVQASEGMPTEAVIDIMYSPSTVWTDTVPFPAMLSATRVYIQPLISGLISDYLPDFTPVRAFTVGCTTGTDASYVLRSAGGIASIVFTVSPTNFTAAELDVSLPPETKIWAGNGQLLANNAGVLTEYSGFDGTSNYDSVDVDASTTIFYDGLDKSAFADAVFFCVDGTWISNGLSLGENLLVLSFPALTSGTAYAKVTAWEITADDISSSFPVTSDGSDILMLVLETAAVESFTPQAINLLYKQHEVQETGIGFTEKDDTKGVEVFKTADDSEFIPCQLKVITENTAVTGLKHDARISLNGSGITLVLNAAEEGVVVTLMAAQTATIQFNTSSADTTITDVLQAGKAAKLMFMNSKWSVMGDETGTVKEGLWSTAPFGKLLAQGQTLLRAKYASLFQFAVDEGLLEETAGDGKPFGLGDGSTTFTIPDLRGEFLRGAGTNSHANQGNGGRVGQHQNATEILNTWSYYNRLFVQVDPNEFEYPASINRDQDSAIRSSSYSLNTSIASASSSRPVTMTTRPTNTSINYAIAY